MVSRPLFSPQEAAELKSIRQQGFDTIELFFDDVYQIRRLDRPDGWDNGSEDEAWLSLEVGVGKLSVSGDGADTFGENVIVNLTPYRFTLRRSTVLQVRDKVIVNGMTEFRVTSVTRGDVDHRFAVAALEELHVAPGTTEP